MPEHRLMAGDRIGGAADIIRRESGLGRLPVAKFAQFTDQVAIGKA
jgi:hypothetical protein